MMRMIKISILVVLILIISFNNAIDISQGLSPHSFPNILNAKIDVILNENIKEANITKTDSGSVTFSGEVIFSNISVNSIYINLTASIDKDWLVSPSNIQGIIYSDIDFNFSIHVIIPPATMADVIGTLLVVVDSGPLYELNDSTTAIVKAHPYYLPNLSCDRQKIYISPSENAYYLVHIFNDGNALDSFFLIVENKDILSRNGWIITMNNTLLLDVPAAKSQNIMIIVNSNSDWSIYKNEDIIIFLNASSEHAKNKAINFSMSPSIVFVLFLHIEGIYYPCFGSSISIIIIMIITISFYYKKRFSRKFRR
jgi:hypothetical protein